MVQAKKTMDETERVREMLGALETTRQFVLDVLQTVRYLFEKGCASAYTAAREEFRFLFKRFTVVDFIFGNLSLLGLLLSLMVVLSGFGILGYQILIWLQDGVWNALPLMMVFEFLFENSVLGQWMQNPESWLGLQQVLKWILENTPISLVLIVKGLFLSAGMAATIALAVMIRRFQFKHSDQG